MAYEFHADPKRYFEMQRDNAHDFVIPWIREKKEMGAGTKVLEVGCGEAGVLKAFWDEGCTCMGIELHGNRIDLAKKFMADEIASGRMDLHVRNIYDADFEKLKGSFDLIVLKDVIEHIPDQKRIIGHLRDLLKPDGAIFFGFPPWNMPFGGHQQVVANRFLSKLPWYHLFPRFMWVGILKMGGVSGQGLQEMAEIWDTGISTAKFERLVLENGMKVIHRKLWFINPIYAFKFGMKPRVLSRILSGVPFFRDFVTTTAFYLTGR